MRVLGLIPARAGSKGIPGKNLRLLAGKPLVEHTFSVAVESGSFDRIAVTTDDSGVMALARKAGIDVPFTRPAELASDDAAMLPVVRHALAELERAGYLADYVVLLQPTAPLRTVRHIRESLDLLKASNADSVVSVTPVPGSCNPYWVHVIDETGTLKPFMANGPQRYTRRQTLPAVYMRDGSIYAFPRETVLKGDSLYGRRCLAYTIPEGESIGLDSEVDWIIAETLLHRRSMQGGRSAV